MDEIIDTAGNLATERIVLEALKEAAKGTGASVDSDAEIIWNAIRAVLGTEGIDAIIDASYE